MKDRQPPIAEDGRERLSIDCCEEPFRLFFPVGALLGVLGVSLWLLYYAGLIITYPATAHARLMIEGFMASFIFGFLGTAGPRITSTRHFSRGELITLLTLDLFSAGLHFGGSHRAGDIFFVFCLASFLFVLGKRFVQRKDSPPPNFALVALGLLNGLAGAVLLALFENQAYSTQYRIGALLLEQGLVLLPILGVAPFLLARLLDLPSVDELPASRALPPGWIERAIFAAAIGLVVDLTLIAESTGVTAIAGWIRLATVLVYLIVRMPPHGRTFLGDCLRAGITAVVVGMGVEALWPQYRIGALHIVFVSGFSFIVLTVAIRVVFGHSGNAHLFQKRLPFFIVVGALIFLAMLSRYVADLAPRTRTIHLIAAAIVWVIAVLIWIGKVIPKVAIADVEE
jgi:uncharacterized protein involved in response to NO